MDAINFALCVLISSIKNGFKSISTAVMEQRPLLSVQEVCTQPAVQGYLTEKHRGSQKYSLRTGL